MIKKSKSIQLDRSAFESFTNALRNVLGALDISQYQNEFIEQNKSDLDAIKAFLKYIDHKENKDLQRQIYKLMIDAQKLGETDKYQELKKMYLENKENLSS